MSWKVITLKRYNCLIEKLCAIAADGAPLGREHWSATVAVQCQRTLSAEELKSALRHA